MSTSFLDNPVMRAVKATDDTLYSLIRDHRKLAAECQALQVAVQGAGHHELASTWQAKWCDVNDERQRLERVGYSLRLVQLDELVASNLIKFEEMVAVAKPHRIALDQGACFGCGAGLDLKPGLCYCPPDAYNEVQWLTDVIDSYFPSLWRVTLDSGQRATLRIGEPNPLRWPVHPRRNMVAKRLCGYREQLRLAKLQLSVAPRTVYLGQPEHIEEPFGEEEERLANQYLAEREVD